MINFLRIIEEKYNNPGPAYDRFYKKKNKFYGHPLMMTPFYSGQMSIKIMFQNT